MSDSGAEDGGAAAEGSAGEGGPAAGSDGAAGGPLTPAGAAARLRGTLVGVALGATGFLGIVVWVNVLAVLVTPLTDGLGQVGITAIGALGLGLGTGTVGLLYVGLTGRPLSYIDFRVPDLWDVAYTVGGVLALFGSLFALSILFALLGTPTSEHSVVRQAEQNPAILLVLIPAAWLLIGPGEELLFRNIVQKSLYGTFSRVGAILVASGIFALAHIQAYYDPNLLAMLPPLSIVFLLSVILGTLYERTGNTTVPALVHGTFDAVLFIVLYLGQTSDGGAAAAVVALLAR